jgi:hypothetical protein
MALSLDRSGKEREQYTAPYKRVETTKKDGFGRPICRYVPLEESIQAKINYLRKLYKVLDDIEDPTIRKFLKRIKVLKSVKK